MLRSATALALFGLAFSTLPAAGEPVPAGELALALERVVVFKDGTALVVKRATGVPDAEGRVHTDTVPDAAALGCFWAAVDERAGAAGAGLRIAAMRAERVEEPLAPGEPIAVLSMLELLRANVGREVRLRLRSADGPEVTGVVTEVLPDAGLVVLRREALGADKASTTALPLCDVHAVHGEELLTRRDPDPATRSAKRLTLELLRGDGPAAGGAGAAPVDLRLFYFTPGLRWIPTYRLTGDLEHGGRLALQAELLNELEDLSGAEVDLVVGVPSFRFGTEISPLTLESTMRNALMQAAPGMGANAFSNALFTQRAMEPSVWNAPAPEAPAPGASVAPELAETGEQDLYVYHAGRVTLGKGARATVTLWDAEVPLEHVYTYDLDLVRGDVQGAHARQPAEDAGGGASPLSLATSSVWHQLRLANLTRHPWTTGPVLLLKDLLPLGQELLTYTPVNGEVLVPVTVAVDVRASYSEEQLKSEPTTIMRGFNMCTRITKRMTVKVNNFRGEVAHTRVQIEMGGEVLGASDGGTIVLGEARASDWDRQEFDHVLNPHSQVSFELELAPGEERLLTLDFVLYST